MHHDINSTVKHFQPIVDGKKRAENRYNDRNYQLNDTITLHEGMLDGNTPGGFSYTGRTVSCRISWIADFGCEPGFVTLSYANVGLLIVRDKND